MCDRPGPPDPPDAPGPRGPGEARSDAEMPVEGVRSLEHTADVGLEVEAPDLERLFVRAARGMMVLLHERVPETGSEGRPPGGDAPDLASLPESGGEVRRLEVDAPDLASLLREWLRELLYWHEVEGFAVTGAEFRRLEPTGLDASVRGGPAPDDPIREIKGVTLHGLVAEEREGGWYGRIIFDV